jgi:hypothetical protein
MNFPNITDISNELKELKQTKKQMIKNIVKNPKDNMNILNELSDLENKIIERGMYLKVLKNREYNKRDDRKAKEKQRLVNRYAAKKTLCTVCNKQYSDMYIEKHRKTHKAELESV